MAAAAPATIATSTRCPDCGVVVPVTITLRTATPQSTDRAVLIAEVDSIDTIDYEAHILGCRGSDAP